MGGWLAGYLQSVEELNSGPPKTNPSSGREQDLNPGCPDYKSSALTTRPRCLPKRPRCLPPDHAASLNFLQWHLTLFPGCLKETRAIVGSQASDLSKWVPRRSTQIIYAVTSLLALKIHVSEDCYRILKEIGGYTFLKRGEVYLKVIWTAAWLTVHWRPDNLSSLYFQ